MLNKKTIKKPVKKIVEREGTIEVTSTIVKGKEVENVQHKGSKIKIRPFVTDTATVSVKLGATINMGDYSSARVDVMFAAPCYIEEMVSVYKQVRKIVSGLVAEEMSTLTGDEGEK